MKNLDAYYAKRFGWSHRRLMAAGFLAAECWVEPKRHPAYKRNVHDDIPKFTTDFEAISKEISKQGLSFSLLQVNKGGPHPEITAYIFSKKAGNVKDGVTGLVPSLVLCKALDNFFKNHPVKRKAR